MDLRKRAQTASEICALLLAALMLTACQDETDWWKEDLSHAGSQADGSSELNAQGVTAYNKAPTIGGTPPLEALAGASYSFAPISTDDDGDRLGFSIRGKPAWASFDPNNGHLTGTPGPNDLGIDAGIVITVSDGEVGAVLPAFSIRVLGPADPPETESYVVDTPPDISGNPSQIAHADQLYLFRPVASDAETDLLNFDIVNKPSWLAFDSASGTLSGIPSISDVGSYSNIWISVSDGVNLSGLGPLTISVVEDPTNSVTLSWHAPTENEDGSPLMDLGGYRVRYGLTAGNYPNLIDISNPSVQSFGIDDLVPETYFFVITAYNSQGNESGFSNEAIITLN